MDIVYSVKPSDVNEELRYSLRSLAFIPHDKLFIVGYLPSFINPDTVFYVPTNPTGNKFQNTTFNLQKIALDERLSEDFIWMDDDFYIMKEIKNPKEELALHKGFVYTVIGKSLEKHGAPTAYMNGAAETMDWLRVYGIKYPLSYELHTPFVYNKRNLLGILCLPGTGQIKILHKRTIYGNLFIKNAKQIKDVKFMNGDKFEPSSVTEKFLSSADKSFPLMKDFLEKSFPYKSKYER